MQDQTKQDKIIFGQFPFRGSMNAVRLICQYIGVQYQNLFLNPVQWEAYRQKQAKDWLYQKIPFLKCGDLVITNSIAAAEFIVQKFNRTDLLGVNQQERIVLNSTVTFQNIVSDALALQCDMKKNKLSQEEKKQKRKNYWKNQFLPRYKKAEEIIKGPWFFSHISWIDFFIYEDYMLFSLIYPEIKNMNKIKRIFQSVSQLPAIKDFEKSQRSIKKICPNQYFVQFAQKYKKQTSQCRSQKSKDGCFSICSKSNKDKNVNGFCPYKKNENEMDIE